MGEIITRVRVPKLDSFVITQKEITDYAQRCHNENDENGDVSEGKIIDYVMDYYQDRLWEWCNEHIDFEKIKDDDEAAAEFARERAEAEKGEY